MKLIDHLYFGQSQAKDMVLDVLATAPSTPVNGQVYYDSALLHAYGRINGAWKVLDNTYNTYSDIVLASGNGIFSGGLTANYIVTYDGAGKLVGVDPTTLGSGHTHALTGDVGGTTAATSVNKVKGTTVTAAASATNQVLYYNGTNYVPTILNIALTGDITVASTAINNTTSLAVTVSQLRGKAFTATQVNSNGFLKFNTSTGWSVDTNTYLTSATGVASIIAGTNITVSGATGDVTVSTSATPTFTTVTTTNFTLNGQNLTYNVTPSVATDLITLGYIQNQSFGLRDFKESVKYIVTSLSGLTYTGTTVGPNGNGRITTAPNTLNATALVVGDRILIAVAGGNAANGIYIVSTVGTGANGVWDRSDDFSDAGNVSLGAYTYVEQTSAGYVLSGPTGTLVIGGASGSALNMIQFSGAGTYTAGTGLSLSGGVFSITNTTVSAGTYGLATPGATQAIPTFTVNAQGQLTAASSFLTNTITNLGTITSGTWNATVITPTYGGTGISSYAVGDLLYASGTTTLSKLADVATGNALISGGVGVAPSWGKIGLTTHVSGILPIANGGTALSTIPTNGQLLIGNGTNYTLATLTAGTAISISNGAGSITINNTGVTSLTGTAGQINVSGSTGNITLSLDTTKIGIINEFSWNPSTTPATLISTGPYSGFYQYAVVHTLLSTNISAILVDVSTGEDLSCGIYSATTLNVASPTYGSNTTVCLRFSPSGWTYISAKTNILIRLTS